MSYFFNQVQCVFPCQVDRLAHEHGLGFSANFNFFVVSNPNMKPIPIASINADAVCIATLSAFWNSFVNRVVLLCHCILHSGLGFHW